MKMWLKNMAMACLLLLTLPAMANEEYRLGVGDVVRITVYGNPDLTTEARVGEDGSITFPLIGTTSVTDQTPASVEKDIAQKLAKAGFIIDPNVNLNVVQYRGMQISVLGRVNRPGKISLEKVSRISDVLALAGGLLPDGSDVITLVRRQDEKTEYRDIDVVALFKPGGEAMDVVMQDGDVINVERQPVFYIYGEVQRPGTFRLEQGTNVVQALSMGGGVTARGTQKGIRVLRANDKGALEEIKAGLADKVQKDDVIYVKESLF